MTVGARTRAASGGFLKQLYIVMFFIALYFPVTICYCRKTRDESYCYGRDEDNRLGCGGRDIE